MKYKTITSLLAVVVIGNLTACSSFYSITNPQKDMAQFLIPGVKEREPQYRMKAEEFVKYAQAGNAEDMIRICSPETVKNNNGAAVLKSKFEEKIIPKFLNSEVEWKGRGKIGYDEDYDVCLAFKGVATRGEDVFKFSVSVFEEDNELVVVYLSAR